VSTRTDSVDRSPRAQRSVLAALLLGFIALGWAGCSETREGGMAQAPPILLISIGTLRADHLGCYGYQRETSPHIDALAAQSVRFEWAFSQAPNTAPSQASILTGLYPATHGMRSVETRLPGEAVTLAEALAERGYTTAAFVDGGYVSAEFGFDQGFALYENSRGGGLAEIGPRAIEWLREHASESFFLMVHTYDVHAPYDPPPGFRDAFLGGLETPAGDFEASAERLEAAASGEQPLTPGELEYAKALYDAEIGFVDHWVGRLMDELRSLGLDERAIVVLIADHGEAFLEHGALLHDTPYTPVIRVPLIVRLPGGEGAGTVPQVVETIDLMPTLLDWAGVPLPPGIQGESLAPLLRGEGRPPYIAFGESSFDGGRKYIVMGGYHLLLHAETGGSELYALEVDALEQDDQSAGEPQRVEALRQRLEEWEQKVALAVLGQEEAPLDDETLEQLRSLGYVH
jgi:arylsulfatase A-like enzyme